MKGGADRLKHLRCHRRNGGVLLQQGLVDLQFGINPGKPSISVRSRDHPIEVGTQDAFTLRRQG